jgi:hypothetical protein
MFIILAVLLIFLLEGIPLIKNKMRNELIAVVVLLLIALGLQICKSSNMITPIDIIKKIFEPVGKMIFKQY